MPSRFVSSIRRRFQRLSQSPGQVAHVLLTRSPLIHPASWASPFDLHVLSTPPAFILSQDQTLHKEKLLPEPGKQPRQRVRSDQKRMSLTSMKLIQKDDPQPKRSEIKIWHLTSARC